MKTEPSGLDQLLAELLAEQRSLTVVEKFAQQHSQVTAHLQAPFYQDLIPLSKPGPGEQYAFQVNLDTCTGCKACVSACHSLNGLEEHETWRDVGLIVGGEKAAPYQQIVTTACHHCAEPGCLQGCPVAAYDKDKETGIVRHLDDQCIGCQYCTMKCPYEVPKYSNRLGIVRKCDMCHDRLAVGEAPACVQACPHEAISITLVNVSQVRSEAVVGSHMIPGAYDSSYTIPTTLYLTKRPIPETARAANAHKLHLEHAHEPLIIMLILSQMSVGMFGVLSLLSFIDAPAYKSLALWADSFAFVILNAGLGAATLHLGRPMGAWRFFLGLRTSWMSREILAFSVLAGAESIATGLAWLMPGSLLQIGAEWSSVLFGIVAVFTSAMIYIDTRRTFWAPSFSLTKFYGATALLGATGVAAIAVAVDKFSHAGLASVTALSVAAALIMGVGLFVWEELAFLRARRDQTNPIHQSALTVQKLLPGLIRARSYTIDLFVVFALLSMLSSGPLMVVWVALFSLFAGLAVLWERYTFFVAVIPYRMPGGV